LKRTLAAIGALLLFAGIQNLDAEPQASMPPCESAPTPGTGTNLPAPTNLRIIKGLFDLIDEADPERELTPSGGPFVPDSAALVGPHDYYFALGSRADCIKAFSLRSQAQIEEYRRTGTRASQVTYTFPNDPDPRKQDAAKLLIDGNSLATQVWLPISVVTGGSVLVTWDAWFGNEFNWYNTGISNYKTFQFTSPTDEIWSEIDTNFAQAKDRGIGDIDGRIYFSTPYPQSTHLGPNISAVHPLTPQVGTFTIKPETWTRYWALYEKDAAGWDAYTLWVADENVGPVKIFDKLQMKFRDGKLGMFRLEYNTSTSGVPAGRGPLVGYARNVVMLRNATDVAALLVKPVR
jgi:hypothetical protein